jgi:outer membrane lipopolysaccharide assembly protein LptE/RlpB
MRRSTRRKRLGEAATLLPVLVLAGCGYALVGKASNIPDDVQQVFLAPFENRTSRLEVEQFLTQAIADELLTRRRFELVSTEAESDATIRGAVTAFRVAPITFTNDGRAQEYELAIVADVSFRRTVATPGEEDGEVIWANDRYEFRESYPVESADADFFDRENIAIEDSAERFADTMVTDLLEGF